MEEEIFKSHFFKKKIQQYLEYIRKELSTIEVKEYLGSALWESYRLLSNLDLNKMDSHALINLFIQVSNILDVCKSENMIRNASNR